MKRWQRSVGILLGMGFAAGAVAAPRLFDVPAQDAVSAIPLFAHQADVQILATEEAVKGKRTHEVHGSYEVEEAIEIFLTRSGLVVSANDGKTITLAADRDTGSHVSSASMSLPSVSGEAVPAQEVTADERQTAAGEGKLEEIIVTAQKREERLIDVPLSVTVVTGAEIANRGITNLADMQYAIPGLTIAQTGSDREILQLNGIASGNGGVGGLPVVGVYLDEMPLNTLGSSNQPQIQLLDMERVEILHGPQPTLYGDGAMGGSIRYVTASPDLTKFAGSAEGWWGGIQDGSDSYRGSVVLNAPLVENKLAVRLAASYEQDGGWIDSNLNGAKNIDSDQLTTLRGKALYRPTDDLSVSFLVLHQEDQSGYQNWGTLNRTTNLNPSPVYRKLDLGNLTLTDNLGAVTLLSSTGYVHDVDNYAQDFTAYFSGLLPFVYPPDVASTVKSISLTSDMDDHVFNQEIRLSSNNEGRFNYLIGGNYRHYVANTATALPIVPASVQPSLLKTFTQTIDQSWSVFGELRYAISDKLQAQVGLRHFADDQSTPTSQASGQFGGSAAPIPSARFTSNNPAFKLSYKTSKDGLVYADMAKGFRSGGNNGAPSSSNVGHLTFAPEELWTYTLGAKQVWLDHRLIADVAAYYNKYNNIQTLGRMDNQPLGYSTNGGRASGPGFDISLTGKPMAELTLYTTVGYSDMHYDTLTGETNPGDPVNLVQKWTYSVSADYRRPLRQGIQLISRIDYQYSSGFSIVVRNLQPGFYETPKRHILNASLGVEVGEWQLSVIGTNLTDDNNPIYPAFGGDIEPTLPTPRTVGVEARLSF